MAQAPKRIRVAALLALGIATGLAGAQQAQQVYRYLDVDGKVVYSDKPPPANAKDAQAKRVTANSIETTMGFATQQAQERYPVTLYTFPCGVVCDTAQGVLNKRGVPHSVVDISQSEGAEKLKKLAGGLDAPALQVGDQYAVGFNETRWQSLLTDAGYPTTPPPRTAPLARPTPAPAPAAAPAAAPTATAQAVQPPAVPKGGYPQQ